MKDTLSRKNVLKDKYSHYFAFENVLLAFLVLTMAGFLIWIAIITIDLSFRKEYSLPVTVVGRSYTPGHMQPQIISNGKTSTTMMLAIPDSWDLHVNSNNRYYSCSVSQSLYDLSRNGDTVQGNFITGRIFGSIHCNSAK